MSTEKFSYYLPPVFNTSPDRELSLREVWEYITGAVSLQVERIDTRTGETAPLGTLGNVTARVRTMTPERYADRDKGKTSLLPVVTFGGTFSQRKTEGLKIASGLICLDIDHISGLGLSVPELRERLAADTEMGLCLLFVSPSGDGLKLICRTSGEIIDRDSYRKEFETLQGYVSKRFDIPVGNSGLDTISDIARGCLICLDPEALLREDAAPFRPEEHPLPRTERRAPARAAVSSSSAGSDWDSFRTALREAIFENINRIFPDMQFTRRGNTWESPLKLDGTPAKGRRREKTVITRGYNGALEHGEPPVDLIDLYKSKNSLDTGEAFRNLARLTGLEEQYDELCRQYAKTMNDNTDNARKQSARGGRTVETVSPEERFSKYLAIPDLKELASKKRGGLTTPYIFSDPEGRLEEGLSIPSGALTIVGAQSSHGKSRFLQNLALQMATDEYNQGEAGEVLYFAFEETVLDVLIRLANIQGQDPHIDTHGPGNTECLRGYFQEGSFPDGVGTARTRISSFVENIYKAGRLRVYFEPELPALELCEVVRYLAGTRKVKAVFLDYLQAIKLKENYSREKREELREVCKALNKAAKELDIPIVLAAQLNRETPNPTDMSGNNIAESADITRYADTILLLWDSSKNRDVRDGKGGGAAVYSSTEDGRRLAGMGFELGKPGKLYASIVKNRNGAPNLEAVLDYVPETGEIKPQQKSNGLRNI
jgi:hypothetical protein